MTKKRDLKKGIRRIPLSMAIIKEKQEEIKPKDSSDSVNMSTSIEDSVLDSELQENFTDIMEERSKAYLLN